VTRIAHRAFFSGVILTVWTTHRGILRQVGYDLATFTRVCRAQYSFYLDSFYLDLRARADPQAQDSAHHPARVI